jgi:DNA-binding XRE family transcriptional regulator
MEFNQIKMQRVKMGYSQLKLAIVAKVSPATIVAIEKYNYVPGPWVRSKLAKALIMPETRLWHNLNKDGGSRR